jgi:hypothetical protein
MNDMPKELWLRVFGYVLTSELFLVCKLWREVMVDMPADMVQQCLDRLIPRIGCPLQATVISNVPRILHALYSKLFINQQIMLPNTLLVRRGQHQQDRGAAYLVGYKSRIPWPVIFNRLIDEGVYKALTPHLTTPELYFKFMFTKYEQYRYYLLTTYPTTAVKRLQERLDKMYLDIHNHYIMAKSVAPMLWTQYARHNAAAWFLVEEERVMLVRGQCMVVPKEPIDLHGGSGEKTEPVT